MLIGIHSGPFFRGIPTLEQLCAIRGVGFEAIDLSLCDTACEFYALPEKELLPRLEALKNDIEKAGLFLSQLHGPWPTDDKSEQSRAEKMLFMRRAVWIANKLCCPYLVVHPVMPYGWGEEADADIAFEMNLSFCRELCDYAAPFGVTVCVENMPMTAHRISPMPRIVELVEAVERENCGICLDTGHANVFGDDAGEMVRLCAPYLKVLHVHDNDGKRDQHLFPYIGTVKWDNFTTALQEIGYQGVLNIESKLSSKMPPALRAKALTLLSSTARHLADTVTSAKKEK